jgi:hypothetical protein
MHLFSLLAPFLAILPACVSAHGDIPGAPRILIGKRTGAELKAKPVSAARPEIRHKEASVPRRLEPRDDRCGPDVGACADGLCCSAEGWCGLGSEYCPAPDCQFQYGSACDANATPAGASTSNIPRPRLGSVAYGGAGIYSCVVSTQSCAIFSHL